MPTTALFTADDLNALPGVSGVSDAEAVLVERVVWGWLKPVLKLTDRPDPVSDELFSWALELGVIFRSNPEGLEEYQLESERSRYSSERRDELLGIAAAGGTTVGGIATPLGSFPAARAYPDPAERCWT
jgi:hypothetical protein